MKSFPGVYPAQSGLKNKWRIKISFTANGKKYEEYKTIEANTEKQAFEKRLKLIEERKAFYEGGNVKSASITFYNLAVEWEKHNALESSTLETYLSTLNNYILPYLGDLEINKITKGTLKNYEEFIRENYNLSDKTLYNQLMIIRTLITYACDKEWLNENNHPFKKYKFTFTKSDTDEEMIYFDDNQLIELMKILEEEVDSVIQANIASTRYKKIEKKLGAAEAKRRKNIRLLDILQKRALVHLAIVTGARRGELVGLKWEQIDAIKKIITFKGTTYFATGEGTQFKEKLKDRKKKTKTLFINDGILPILVDMKEVQDKVIKENKWKNEGYLFISLRPGKIQSAGSCKNSDTFSDWFSSLCYKYKDRLHLTEEEAKEAHLHMLRHSSISFELNNNIPAEIAAKRGGHLNSEMVNKVYGHIYNKKLKEAANVYDELYDKADIKSKI